MAIKTIPKNPDGGWYYPEGKNQHGIVAGDIIEMTGDYAYVYLDAVIGTKAAPVRFRPKGVVRCGTNGGYGWIISNSKYFIIESDETNRFVVGGLDGVYIGQSFSFGGSDNLEIYGMELKNAQVGFFSNRKGTTDQRFENIYIHNCHIHKLANPDEGGRAEGFYIGNTDKAYYQKGPHLHNVRIENNLIEDVTGDGIQMAKCTNLTVKNNVIRRYGTGNLENQRTGIIVGGCSTGSVVGNTIQDGKGGAIQVFGAGEVIVDGNDIQRTSTNPTDDAIYIDGKCSDGPALQVRLLNNKVDHAARDIVRDVKGNAVIENAGNSWNEQKPPEPPPAKKLLYTVTTKIYDTGVPETTTVTVKK